MKRTEKYFNKTNLKWAILGVMVAASGFGYNIYRDYTKDKTDIVSKKNESYKDNLILTIELTDNEFPIEIADPEYSKKFTVNGKLLLAKIKQGGVDQYFILLPDGNRLRKPEALDSQVDKIKDAHYSNEVFSQLDVTLPIYQKATSADTSIRYGCSTIIIQANDFNDNTLYFMINYLIDTTNKKIVSYNINDKNNFINKDGEFDYSISNNTEMDDYFRSYIEDSYKFYKMVAL